MRKFDAMWLAKSSKGCQSRAQMLRRGALPHRVHQVLADSHPAWLAAPPLLASLTLADLLMANGYAPLRSLLGAAAVGITSGAVLGLGLTALFEGLKRAPTWGRLAAWPLVGAVLGLWLCDALSVRNNLGGPYDRLARSVIKASIGLGLGVTLVGWLIQPTPRRPGGLLGALHWSWRTLLAIVSGSLAVGLTVADRQGHVVEYPSASWLLRWLSLSAAFIAVLLATPSLVGSVRVKPWLSQNGPWVILSATVLGVVLVGNQEASRLLARPFGSSALVVLQTLTDFDRDGHSGLFGGGDCRAFDSAVGPHRREIAGNGIDDNCRGGDAPKASKTTKDVSHALAIEPAGAPPEPAVDGAAAQPMSVVYITVDTVGAAALSTYGNSRKTTPRLDRWAQRAVVFEEAYTAGSSTAVALSATFRGVYPRRVKWTRTTRNRSGKLTPTRDRNPLTKGERRYRLPLRDPRVTLPEALGEQGIRTLAVSTMHLVAQDSNVAGEFDRQVALTQKGSRNPYDQGVTKQALTWLRNLKTTDRYFMWVHYLGPHGPSTKTKGVPTFGTSERDLYDHEIATFDQRVGPLLEELTKRQERGEAVAVIVSADHGEEFMSHRFHGHSVSDRVAHIPLMFTAPGFPARRTRALVSSVDVFPTVLSMSRVPLPDDLDGRDLTPVLRGDVDDWSRVVFTDGWVYDSSDRLQSNQVMATDGKARLTVNLVNMAEELLDVSRERSGALQENLLGSLDDSGLRVALDSYLDRAITVPSTN